MKKHITMAVFSLVAAVTVAQAGQEGHGGRVYFCKNSGNSDSAELLDYYLGRTRWGMDLRTQTGQNEIEIVTKTLDGLKKIDPSRAAVYLARAKNFMNRASMGDENDFKDTDDVQTVLGSRKDCNLKLVIRQNIGLNPFIPEEKKFLINQDSWAGLDAVQRAGLILHEIILEDSAIQGSISADGAMYVHALITSKKMDSMDRDQFLGTLTQTGFQGAYQGNVLVAFKDIQYYPTPSIVVQSGQIIAINDRSAPPINTLNNPGGTLDLAGKITFREDGTPSAVAWAQGDVLQGTKETAFKNVLFHPNATIMAGTLEATTAVSFFGNTEPLRESSQLNFYPSGALQAIVTSTSLDFNLIRTYGLPPGGQLTFTEQGSIRQADLEAFTFSYQGKYVVGIGTTVFGDHGQVTATTLGKKAQLKMADGTTRKLRAGTALILLDGAHEVVNGIYNLDDASKHFIRIDTQGESVGFRYCEILHPDHCEQIGKQSLYTRKELRQHLKLNLRDSLFTRYAEDLEGVAGGMAVGIIGAGAIGGAVYFGIASVSAGVDVVLGSLIGVFWGGMVYGVPVAMGAVIGVGIPVMGAVGIADLPVFLKRRAITDIIKRHVLTTDQSIDGIRSQMDAALATIL